MLNKGFTLIELIVTIAILGIMLTIAIPSFRSLIINNRIATQSNDFISDIAHARAEAVRRNARISICKSNTGTSCVASANWQDGWVVWLDSNNDGVVNTGETILRVHGPLASGITLVATGFNSGTYFQYLPSGVVGGVAGGTPTTAGTLTLCQSGYYGRTINFNTTGRVNITTMTSLCP
jgi:type IV fimbrial biogenesis protein FimT